MYKPRQGTKHHPQKVRASEIRQQVLISRATYQQIIHEMSNASLPILFCSFLVCVLVSVGPWGNREKRSKKKKKQNFFRLSAADVRLHTTTITHKRLKTTVRKRKIYSLLHFYVRCRSPPRKKCYLVKEKLNTTTHTHKISCACTR
jgi:hypothetical protein